MTTMRVRQPSPYVGPGIQQPWEPNRVYYHQDIVKQAICTVAKCKLVDLKKKDKSWKKVMPRSALYYFLHEYSAMSLADISELMVRTRSAVLYGKTDFKQWLEQRNEEVVRFATSIAKAIDNIQSSKNHSPHDDNH